MANQQSPQEDSLSAIYLENYLDCMENLPNDIQRYISRIKDLDTQYNDYMQKLESSMEELMTELDKTEPVGDKERSVFQEDCTQKRYRVEEVLIWGQSIADEKRHIAEKVEEYTEIKVRLLEQAKENLQHEREMESQDSIKDDRIIKRTQRAKPSILGSSPAGVTLFHVDPNNIHDSYSGPRNVEFSESSEENVPSTSHTVTEKEASTSSSAAASTISCDNSKASSSTQIDKPGPSGTRGSERVKRRSRAEKVETYGGSQSGEGPSTASASIVTPKKQSGRKAKNNIKKYQKPKARKTQNQNTSSPVESSNSDSDEPRYCFCEKTSFGDMIGCDNELCPREWFHFPCVNLTQKPKGKWYCPKCRGDKPNIMKSMTLILEELEKYNREKDEEAY